VAKNLIMVANMFTIRASVTANLLPKAQTLPALLVHKDGEYSWYAGTGLASASVQEIEKVRLVSSCVTTRAYWLCLRCSFLVVPQREVAKIL
jgi:hypothetical protein